MTEVGWGKAFPVYMWDPSNIDATNTGRWLYHIFAMIAVQGCGLGVAIDCALGAYVGQSFFDMRTLGGQMAAL